MSVTTKHKNIFVSGAISAEFVAQKIKAHQAKLNIGAHSIFLGQVRADEVQGRKVSYIEYTAYEELALEQMNTIRDQTFKKFDLTCLHVYHSLGKVNAGQVSLFVFTSSAHRKAAIDACEEIVERIKKELPVWGKEIMEDDTYIWKQNH